jgi:hypothetical protein
LRKVLGMSKGKLGTLLTTIAGAISLAACHTMPPAGHAREEVSPTTPLKVAFDYSAAELMIAAMKQPSLSETEVRTLLQNRGIGAMVAKMGIFFPKDDPSGFVATPEIFVQDMLKAVNERKTARGPFGLNTVQSNLRQVESLITELRANEVALSRKLQARLGRYTPAGVPKQVNVYFVAGGSSDGFVLDSDPEPAFFEALDRAEGDMAGVQQVLSHELYHVMQKTSGMRSAGYARFVRNFESQPPMQKLLATLLWEGTANFAADPRNVAGTGPYISMWRDRYVENETSERRQENFDLLGTVVSELDSRRTDWETAYERGFSNERFYHVGMEMARALVEAHGPEYLKEVFTRPPSQFFLDYLELASSNPALPKFTDQTQKIIKAQPHSW